MPSAKSLENLKKGKKWPKGQSGNPKGREPELPELGRLVRKVLGEEKNDMTATEALLRKLLHRALTERGVTGVRATEVLLERGYGKVESKLDVTSEGKSIAVPAIIFPSGSSKP